MPDKPEGTMTVPDEKLRGDFETWYQSDECTRVMRDGDAETFGQAAYAAGYQACKKQAAERLRAAATLSKGIVTEKLLLRLATELESEWGAES